MSEKTNIGLVEYAKEQLGRPYWYGTFGQTGTESLLEYKAKQYPTYYSETRKKTAKKYHIGKRVHDCVGLMKGYAWSETNSSVPKYTAAQDKSADGTYNAATEKGTLKTIPEIPGICVHKKGHVGVYIGGGYVIEARGFDYGVVKTKLSDRGWLHWFKYPYIEYVQETKPASNSSSSSGEIKAGDKVAIKPGSVYGGNSNGVKVPSKYADGKQKFTVQKVQKNNGQQEALLKELVSWVALKYLTK